MNSGSGSAGCAPKRDERIITLDVSARAAAGRYSLRPGVQLLALFLLLCGLCPAPSSAAPFRGGPLLLEVPPADAGPELGFASREEIVAGRWPATLLRKARNQLKTSQTVLLVGRTDPLGPRALNRSLGLQYAAEAARGLASALHVDLARFACASVGEEVRGPPGVTALAWSPPRPEGPKSTRATILEPSSAASPDRLWAFWDRGATQVVWGFEGPDGARTWQLDPSPGSASLVFPARASSTAVGARFPGGGVSVASTPVFQPQEDKGLDLRIEERRSWSARLAGRLTFQSSAPVVWACGIPYPVVGTPNDRFEVEVALRPDGCTAFFQGTDSEGRVQTGPPLALPAGEGRPPDLIAVLVWLANGADLNLHAWSGARHTQPQDPDDAFSSTAVPGVRLLFDGDETRPASVLLAIGADSLELDVQCHVDRGGAGTIAWLYLLSHPGDPLRERSRLVGPRFLSSHPLRSRWPAARWKEE